MGFCAKNGFIFNLAYMIFLPIPGLLYYPKIFTLIGKKDNGSIGADSDKQAA